MSKFLPRGAKPPGLFSAFNTEVAFKGVHANREGKAEGQFLIDGLFLDAPITRSYSEGNIRALLQKTETALTHRSRFGQSEYVYGIRPGYLRQVRDALKTAANTFGLE